MNYFDVHTHVSNSGMKAARDAADGKERPVNLQRIFNFGHLVEALIAEPWRVSVRPFGVISLDIESGGKANFTVEEYKIASAMAKAYLENPVVNGMFAGAVTQYAFYRNTFRFKYEGFDFELPIKVKFDLIKRGVIGGDIKTTACTTEAGFVASIEQFDYDQAAALYMDVAGLDRFVIIGISKTKKHGRHQIFIYPITRGDATYERGLRKYSALAFKYYFTIHQLAL